MLAFAMLLQAGLIFAQGDTEKLLIGKWAVTEAEALLGPDIRPAEGAIEGMDSQLEFVKDKLLKAKFEFLNKNKFVYDVPDRDTRIEEGLWSLSGKHIRVTGGEADNIKTLMEIDITNIDVSNIEEKKIELEVSQPPLIYKLSLTKQVD